MTNQRKWITWIVVTSILLFGGWALRGEMHTVRDSIARIMMTFGLMISGILIYIFASQSLKK